jgi:hypothetical protein
MTLDGIRCPGVVIAATCTATDDKFSNKEAAANE